ncbi:AIR synthase [Acidaminobacter sp. JC074]|uniref:AIR synthase family protein n=1 Tax=Acidaminobacter sp. JC074 TaxID=2530199 RepID=UPI001F0F513F|nr:AIR synthase family protein [Acidaminobacter sp. JC074]MCH4889879.1 AIR synthase [Acidaminobacter sp. JC074]
MKIGKLNNDQLQSIIMDSIQYRREDVVLRSGIGEDCAGVRYGDEVCLLTTDPITGAANEVGKLAVHISCNDIASNGASPIAILLTILAPESTTEEDLKLIMTQAHEEASKLNVEIVGGHTEITSAVNRIVVSSTAIGKQKLDELFSNNGIKEGDLLVMTKSAGLEGTGIIAYEKYDELINHFDEALLKSAKNMLDKISVVKEGVIAGKFGVSSMHDITEGGLLGAIWEICEGAGLGAIVKYESISIPDATSKICDHYKINPLRLISSGTMLMSVAPSRADALLETLTSEGIEANIIGEITRKDVYLEKRGRLSYVTPPDSDELYKVVF